MPKHSYINIYDYSSIKALVNGLKRIGNNKELYESYLLYKKHDKDISKLKAVSLDDKLKDFKDVIDANATTVVDGIAGKVRCENKICKFIRFVRQTPWHEIVERRKTPRIDVGTACLSHRGILTYFDLSHKNRNQPESP